MKTKLALTILILFVIGFNLQATIFRVGPGHTLDTPNALFLEHERNVITIANGDTIEIEAGNYVGVDALAVWRADSLLIRGVNGKPHLQAAGEYIWGKGIWVIAGNDCRVEQIEFSGAAVPDKNGAGIRLDGDGLTVRHCHFHDNENGILTSNSYKGQILIEYSEFGNNGFGDGFSHNIYVGHVQVFTMRFCYMHHAHIGHNIKSRAENNFIVYNRIMDEADGEASMLLDLPNGGFSVVMGNIFMQGPKAINKRLITYGAEGLINTNNQFYMSHNTLVNERHTGTFVYVEPGTPVARMVNNVMIGIGDAFVGTTDTAHNRIFTDTTGLGLWNYAHFDYRLRSGSPLIDAGTMAGWAGAVRLTPKYVYMHYLDSALRPVSNAPDLGAYEYQSVSTSLELVQANLYWEVFPNPVTDHLYIRLKEVTNMEKITLHDVHGKRIKSWKLTPSMTQLTYNFRQLPQGIYVLSGISGQQFFSTKIIH